MKIKSVTIRGMNNSADSSYHFNEGFTYLHGKNGTGKSTVLKAIQLALLGYIPNEDKTNQSIYKHANHDIMSVAITLDDNGNELIISRSFTKCKNSIKSSFVIIPEGRDISNIVSAVELPIFNFSEFMNMSSNKMKEWFLDFLPISAHQFTWRSILSKYSDNCYVPEGLIDQIIDNATLTRVCPEELSRLNAYLKSEASALKSDVTRLSGTIQSMVYYADVGLEGEEGEVQSRITCLRDTYQKALQARQGQELYKMQLARLASLNWEYEIKYKDFDLNGSLARLHELQEAFRGVTNELAALEARRAALRSSIIEKKKSLSMPECCPYTGSLCDEALQHAELTKTDVQNSELALNKLVSEIDDLNSEAAEQERLIKTLSRSIDDFREFQSSKQAAEDSLLVPSDSSDFGDPDEIWAELVRLQEVLSKLAANAKYIQLHEMLTKQKYEDELKLAIYKKWIECTGPNGVYNELAQSAFDSFKQSMDTKLSRLIRYPCTCDVVLSNKANSFSIGLNINGKYVPYELLSSGERCLFSLAFMSTVVSMSDASLKVLMIDDTLDNLDEENSKLAFDYLSSLADIQVISAGVNIFAPKPSILRIGEC